jgi:hypothetical protein
MVAVKTPTLEETYKALCGFLRKNPKLSVVVVNHIAAKHRIHTLPSFHMSDEVSEADKLTTCGELSRALVEHAKGTPRALNALQGQVASGQAEAPTPEAPPPEAPPAKRISDLPTFEAERRAPVADPEPEPEPEQPAPEPEKPAPRASDPLTDQLRKILRELIGELPASLDENKVRGIAHVCANKQAKEEVAEAMKTLGERFKAVDEAIAAAKANAGIARHEFKIGEQIRPVEGVIHCQLPQVVAWANANVPVWLWGMAGAGKTHMGRQLAEALGVPFYCAPIDETITVGKLVGFRNLANGDFVPGLIYKAYKEGGVLLLDEIDTNSATIAALNSALANDHYTFPNGEEVPRHANFRVIAGANTKGTGAVAGYTARVRLDAATLDRFAVIELNYDPGLELALACGIPNPSEPWKPGPPATPELCRKYVEWVQNVRGSSEGRVLISPRASYLGVRALLAGIPVREVAEALVFKLVEPDTRTTLLQRAGLPPTA